MDLIILREKILTYYAVESVAFSRLRCHLKDRQTIETL